MNIYDVQGVHSERLFLADGPGRAKLHKEWTDVKQDSGLAVGAYVETGASIALSEVLSIGVFGRYDFNEDVSGSVGPSSYSFDLDAWTGSVFCTLEF
ncbi:MAG: hypothetical protein ACI9R3_002571 [Verrucomicrobiales bacterium]